MSNPRPQRYALVIDSDPASRASCCSMLNDIGFSVATVDNGVAGLIAARGRRPDLILLAGQLRDVPACEALRWLRTDPVLKGTPIIMLQSPGDAPRGGDVGDGPTVWLGRPASVTTFERTIRDLIDHKRSGTCAFSS